MSVGIRTSPPWHCPVPPSPALTLALLPGSYTRDQPLFLQLKDYFWVRTPSLYELPYGTKGSGKPRRGSLRPSVHPTATPWGFQLLKTSVDGFLGSILMLFSLVFGLCGVFLLTSAEDGP